MRVLFDQGTPVPLAQFLVGHTISTSAREGWSRYQNSDLLDAAEAAGFDVLVTTDKNLRYQQILQSGRLLSSCCSSNSGPTFADMCILSLPPLTQRHPVPIPKWRFRNPPL